MRWSYARGWCAILGVLVLMGAATATAGEGPAMLPIFGNHSRCGACGWLFDERATGYLPPSPPWVYHPGWDFNLTSETGVDGYVYAMADGVAIVGSVNGNGVPDTYGELLVRHEVAEQVFYSAYYHCSRIYVQNGQTVKKGNRIAQMGDIGAGQVHLHWEVRVSPGHPNPEDPGYWGYSLQNESNVLAWYRDPEPFVAGINIDTAAGPQGSGTDIGSKDGALFWWHGFDGNDLYFPDKTAKRCYRQNFTGGNWGNCAVVFDAVGGARRAYTVRTGFWANGQDPANGWSQLGGPQSELGMPITDEYGQDGSNRRQDFQKKYLYFNGSTVSVNPYPHGGPGWTSYGWNNQYSYLFALAYERNGARNTVGEPTGAVYSYGDFKRQDFSGGSFGNCCILYDPNNAVGNVLATNEAYLLRGGFYDYYMNNGGYSAFGCPTRDEYSSRDPEHWNESTEYPLQNFFRVQEQDDPQHYMIWKPGVDVWHSAYHTLWVTQSPNEQIDIEQGTTRTWMVQYRNTGTTTWFRDKNAYPYDYIELVSCDGDGAVVPSFFYSPGLGWIDAETPCTMQEASVAPGSVATFSFQGQIATNDPLGSRDIYFRVRHSLAGLLEDWGGMHYVITVVPRTPYDFDGDGFSDAWDRTSTGLFHIDFCDDGLYGWEWTGQNYGGTQDTPCPADYDGDGICDIAVLRNADRKFLIDLASNNLGWFDITHLGGYGGYGDIPLPADYDGDGSADIAVRDADGDWHVDYSSNGLGSWDVNEGGYGGIYDTPCAGDFNGDGHADIAILRNVDRKFLIDLWAPDGFHGYDRTDLGGYGGYGDTPCPADYDHDGTDDVSVRDADRDWHIDYAANGFGAWDWTGYGYGSTPNPTRPGDYDGDGHIDFGVYFAPEEQLCFDRLPYGAWDACDGGHPSWKQPGDPTAPEPDGPTVTLERADRNPVTVELFDVSGRLITSQVRADVPGSLLLARRIVHERSLPGGIYFVRLLGPSGRTTQKLVILR